jgi:tetratricopeptide (TPR) repeat protein
MPPQMHATKFSSQNKKSRPNMNPTSILRFAISVGIWLFITTISHSAPADNAEKITDLQRDVTVIKDTTTLRLEAQKDALQKDLQNLQSKIDQQDKRIGDIAMQNNQFSTLLTVFAIIISILALLAGIAGWFSAGIKAREEARDWLKNNSSELNVAIKKVITEVVAASDVATTKIKDSVEAVEVAKKQFQESLISPQVSSQSNELKDTPLRGDKRLKAILQKDTLLGEDKRLKEIPEAQYTFKDWTSRAFAAFASDDFEDAAHFFLQASVDGHASQSQVVGSLLNRGLTLYQLKRYVEAINAYDRAIILAGESVKLMEQQVASAMLNKGLALGKLQRADEEITVYDELITRFNRSTELELLQQLSAAMFNKGVALSEGKRFDEAINVYDQLLKRFLDSTDSKLQEHVANAMLNKAFVFGQLNQDDRSIKVYDQLIKRFSNSNESTLGNLVRKALNGVGFFNLVQAKNKWNQTETRTVLLTDARSKFESILEHLPDSPIALGNLSYTLFLQGLRMEAVTPLSRALRLGGEEIFKGLLKDTETNAVPDDAAFRTLLEKNWNEVRVT